MSAAGSSRGHPPLSDLPYKPTPQTLAAKSQAKNETAGMTQARKHIVSIDHAGTYHCVSRCVRRSWLCGWDSYLQKSFEHRKPWVERKIAELAGIFACSILSYAVMSNHFHLVVSMLPAEANAWSAQQVAERWCRLFPKKKPEEHHLKIETIAANAASIAVHCQRLHDLSWLMKMISEPIARRANTEDKTNGRFWQGRFKCQLLLSEKSILAAMAYVDLNPIRAKIADSLTTSKHTRKNCRFAYHVKAYKHSDTRQSRAW